MLIIHLPHIRSTALQRKTHLSGKIFFICSLRENEAVQDVANYYIGLTRKLYAYMTPFVSKNRREAFSYRVKYLKGNVKRLMEIKKRVDLGNFFRNEQRIPLFPRHL
ncbi:Berberine/berberine-like [Parasponia andersonii]|uniref:Berberine/berberine-like n=1 Tax=Parasponia andersonii TaxID=3476 RepID=A0A2P5AQK6_PARAD|nr:Berberine/berberine-like [Parasponia andersonii]